ncbi:TIGR03619 family F420-dependent LLM class oxidoreductase [Phytoactinopolyspora limicola]|uniref:TIGR03619 family F420-dependent LLM class oxidoreductase n=1 Tax=Phytoactinopolyspora limicola TaxID=2715536 RepID=UPI00140888A9|nr:TIGR03619 family F420-dependent LLM class oxidoreductase [Phytoactinopolyspora limicola]
MTLPRMGIGLPTFGPYAGPQAITTVAAAAERLGYHSVSVSERLLLPAGPEWSNDAGLPASHVWDPIEALTWAAASTTRVRVGTAVMIALFQPPIILARRLATLDALSGGRLDVGLGQGWLPEEFTATGVAMSRRGRGFEEYVAALRACWAPDPVQFEGARYQLPLSIVGPKPSGQLPIYIGAVARPAVERAARLADGFIGAVRTWADTRNEIGWYRDAGGIGPVVLRCAHPDREPVAFAANFVATALADLENAADVGAAEVHWDMNLASVPTEKQVELLEVLATKVSGG